MATLNKQSKYMLDAQETIAYYDDLLESTAILMWNTRYSAFTFAFFLNRLYALDLKPDTVIDFQCNKQLVESSIFSFHNPTEKMSYFLVDNSPESMQRISELSYFDKVLLIMGEDSKERADFIFSDIRSVKSNPADMLVMQREETKSCFVESGVVAFDTFDFSNPDNPSSSFLSEAAEGSSLYRKQQKFLKIQRDYFQGLFVAIDDLMRDFE